MNFTAVILAGGRSRRMGRDKAGLVFNGKPLIGHSLGIARESGAGEVLISARAGQEFSALGCPVLFDAMPDCGPLAGIERALDAAKHSLVLVLAVDLPRMDPGVVQWLASHCKGGSGAIPICKGQPEPLGAFYPRRAGELARRLLRQKRLAARQFAEACIREKFACAVPVPKIQEGCFTNWNTPEEMQGAGDSCCKSHPSS